MGAEGDSAPGPFLAVSVLGSLPKCPEEVRSLCTLLPLQALPSPPLADSQRTSTPWASGGVDCPVFGRRQAYPKCSLSRFTVSELCDGWGGTPHSCASATPVLQEWGLRLWPPRPSRLECRQGSE